MARGGNIGSTTASHDKVRSSNPAPVKPMIYIIDSYYYRAWCFALVGKGKDQLAQYQDNTTEYNIGSRCWLPDIQGAAL